jgi:hypothetical protein
MLASKASPAAFALMACFTTVRSELVMWEGCRSIDLVALREQQQYLTSTDYEGKEEEGRA